MSDLKIENLQPIPAQINQNSKPQSITEFNKVISGAIDRVNSLDQAADRSIMDLLKGKADIHETMIALQKSDISMKTFLAVRNKVIEAYREIMRMQF